MLWKLEALIINSYVLLKQIKYMKIVTLKRVKSKISIRCVE